MDFALVLKVLKEFYQAFAGALFDFVVGVVDSSFCEEIGESKCRMHVVEFDFLDTAHGVIFERDVHPGVLLTRHVKKFSVVSQNLFPFACDLNERAFAVETDNVGVLPIDCRFLGDISGQNC